MQVTVAADLEQGDVPAPLSVLRLPWKTLGALRQLTRAVSGGSSLRKSLRQMSVFLIRPTSLSDGKPPPQILSRASAYQRLASGAAQWMRFKHVSGAERLRRCKAAWSRGGIDEDAQLKAYVREVEAKLVPVVDQMAALQAQVQSLERLAGHVGNNGGEAGAAPPVGVQVAVRGLARGVVRLGANMLASGVRIHEGFREDCSRLVWCYSDRFAHLAEQVHASAQHPALQASAHHGATPHTPPRSCPSSRGS